MHTRPSYSAALAFLLLGAGCCLIDPPARHELARVAYDDLSEEQRKTFLPEPSPQPAAQLDKLSLMACCTLAVANSERLALALEDYLQAMEEKWRAWSLSLPKVALKGSYYRQKKVNIGSFSPNREKEYHLEVEQPIFGGFREFNSVRRSSDLIRARKAGAQDERNRLFLAIAETFYEILRAEHEVAAISASLKVQEERRRQVNALMDAGVARRSELLLIEATLANDGARLARAKQQVVTSRDRLAFLIGVPAAQPLVDADLPASLDQDVSALIARGLQHRPDFESLRHEAKAAEKTVLIAKGAFAPSVSLVGDYYGHREGFKEDVDWELSLEAEVKLFEGGRRVAELRQAQSRMRQARLRLRERSREIEFEIRQAHAELATSRSLMTAREAQYKAAEEAHRLVSLEYQTGVATNLEVLAAQNALLDARVELENERLSQKVSGLRLQAAIGELPLPGAVAR